MKTYEVSVKVNGEALYVGKQDLTLEQKRTLESERIYILKEVA